MFITIQWNLRIKDTLGFGTSHFVLNCREVVLSLEVENVLVLWESEQLGTLRSVLYREVISIVSLIQRVHYQLEV